MYWITACLVSAHLLLLSCVWLCLQLATRHSAVLFDLITLASSHPAALDACLCPLFSSSDVLKLGFELHGDLSKLAGSWPAVAAFRAVAGVLDLRPLWIAYGLATRRQVRWASHNGPVGCTGRCVHALCTLCFSGVRSMNSKVC